MKDCQTADVTHSSTVTRVYVIDYAENKSKYSKPRVLPLLKEVCATRVHATLRGGSQVFQAAATRHPRHPLAYH